jgi:hypothetical protein
VHNLSGALAFKQPSRPLAGQVKLKLREALASSSHSLRTGRCLAMHVRRSLKLCCRGDRWMQVAGGPVGTVGGQMAVLTRPTAKWLAAASRKGAAASDCRARIRSPRGASVECRSSSSACSTSGSKRPRRSKSGRRTVAKRSSVCVSSSSNSSGSRSSAYSTNGSKKPRRSKRPRQQLFSRTSQVA